MLHYRIKLNDSHYAKSTQVRNGYLAFDDTFGNLEGAYCIYTRGEAIKKARVFGGKIEVLPTSKTHTALSMLQIPEYSISGTLRKLMDNHRQFNDVSLHSNEAIYSGDVFFNILREERELDENITIELSEYVQMCNADYIMVIK